MYAVGVYIKFSVIYKSDHIEPHINAEMIIFPIKDRDDLRKKAEKMGRRHYPERQFLTAIRIAEPAPYMKRIVDKKGFWLAKGESK